MKKTVKLLSLLMVFCMLLSSCAQGVGEVATVINDSISENNAQNTVVSGTNTNDDAKVEQLSTSTRGDGIPEKGTYNEGVALVKYDGEMNDNVLSQLNLVSATALYSGSTWYTVELKADADTVETVTYLRELGCFDKVDYDYIMGVTAEVESVDISGNPAHGKQNDTFKTHHIKEGWDYLKKNGMNPGGSSDVVIAVIDTGVDYTHLDLRNNIWVNSAEIPDNGIDDDGNGYIDDLCGWDCVGDDKDPMDDNGHGTHVAGIIAAENNKEGGIGVAYNCKVMVLKAGNSSGYFNNSDIAEAIQYAYMNGASVINMSFGGSNISFAVEEALENAYNQCVLVAAAGNYASCNNLACPLPQCIYREVSYPAALPYVIGVMSTDASGMFVSGFSNYDHKPHDSVEYETYAVGEAVYSTWPGNKYTTLSGTSMAAPTVSAIAALLRSAYPDREVYSTKYLQSQIVNTGTINPYNALIKKTDGGHSVANVYDALTKLPKPSVNLYGYYVFDNVEFSAKNNGDGRIDAGETIRIGIELMNRGGVASDVRATIDTIRNGDQNLVDPYFEIIKGEITLSDIGTYSVRDSGLIYTGELVTATEKYFEIIVSEDCPNDYLCVFNLNLSYTNGMDDKDTTTYTDEDELKVSVTNGVVLPASITEDTVFPGNKRYIVSRDVTIAEGVTVTFESGAIIQFYENSQGYYDTLYNSPQIINYGTLNFNGVKDNIIEISPSELFAEYICLIGGDGTFNFRFANITNLVTGQKHPIINFLDCSINLQTVKWFSEGAESSGAKGLDINNIEKSIVRGTNYYSIDCVFANKSLFITYYGESLVHSGTMVGMAIGAASMENCLVLSERYSGVYAGGVVPQIELGEYGNASIKNNVFMNCFNSRIAKDYPQIVLDTTINNDFIGNKFYGMYKTHPEVLIRNLIDSSGNYFLDVNDPTHDGTQVWPFITGIRMEDMNGNVITKCGTETVKFVVDFNRDMDTSKDTKLFFGTIEPYADYEIEGEWVSARQWVGTYTLKATIENGEQRFRLENAWSAATEDTDSLECLNNGTMYTFTIDTTSAQAMLMQAVAEEGKINLSWVQDDYNTLLGYNVYRSTEKDGNFVRINPAVIPAGESTFADDNAEPGKTYWYTYTVVLTDFTESNPAGKVQATAMDTLAPNMYHTPVNQGYMNNNLVISCTASDNVAISTVTLYYRAIGATEWKTLGMAKQSDKYSATIFGSELTLDGVEYYIVATDGRNTINKGSEETPYTILIKDASSISRKGDVDGDGVVTTKDALMLMQCINGDLILSDDEFKRADLNGDGVLNSSEALRILQYINGKVNTLEM